MEEFSRSGEIPDNPGMDVEALQEGVPTEDDALIAR